MNKIERFISPRKVFASAMFAGVLAIGFARGVEAAAPTDPADSTTTIADTSVTPNTGVILGDIYCPFDGGLYSTSGPASPPDNCDEEPTDTILQQPDIPFATMNSEAPQLNMLPKTGSDSPWIAGGAACVLAMGAALSLVARRELSL